MEKFLIFIDDADDAVMYPVSRLRAMTVAADATILCKFDNSIGGTSDNDHDVVTITCAADKEKEVFVAIAQQLTRNVNGPVVVVDDVTGNHCSPHITSCTITLIAS